MRELTICNALCYTPCRSRTMADPEESLAKETPPESDELILERLIWDRWNVEHIARHDVSPSEVEQVCHNDLWVRRSYWNRLILIGLTDSKQVLAVVLEPVESGSYYTVSARHASRKERRHFQAWKEGKVK